MTVRVEFCGVPASGKSTLCAGARRLLNDRGRHVLGRDEMIDAGLASRNFGVIGNIFGNLIPGWRRKFLGLPHSLNDWHRFAIEYPSFVAILHNWLAEKNVDEDWRSAILYSFFTSAFEYRISIEIDRPVLMDEGFAQRFYSLCGYSGVGQPGDPSRYAEKMPLPSALILVFAPPELCVERVQRRDHIPVLLQDEPLYLLPARFAEGSALLERLTEELERRHVAILRVDGAASLETEAEKIADFVEKIISKPF